MSIVQALIASAVPSSGPPTTWNALMASLLPWGWWKLDETAGTSVAAVDSSGNGRNGSYSVAGTQGAGLFGGSTVSQTVINGRINLPTYNMAATPRFSVGLVIRTTSTGSEQQIISADPGSGSNRAWQFRKSTSNNALEFITIMPSVTTTTGATSVSDGNPHLAILVYDQTLAAADGRVKLYRDGSLDGESTTAITITGSMAAPPAIGTRANSQTLGLWTGAVDEAFLFDRALSASEVSQLWAARNSP